MLRNGALQNFDSNAQPEWRYLRSLTRNVLDCVHKEVSLEEIGEDRQARAVNVKIAITKVTGLAVMHLATLLTLPKDLLH